MYRNTAIMFVSLIIFCSNAYCKTQPAQIQKFGIGIILGEPTGISFKDWLTTKTAIDGGIAWTLAGENASALHLHMDYLFHNFDVIKPRKGSFPIYYGIGGSIKFRQNSRNEDTKVSLRIPVGINYLFSNTPIDLFLEIVPMLDLTPNTEFELNGGVGIRYYF